LRAAEAKRCGWDLEASDGVHKNKGLLAVVHGSGRGWAGDTGEARIMGGEATRD